MPEASGPRAEATGGAEKGEARVSRLAFLGGALGIYFFFIQHGRLQERIFRFRALDGSKFDALWFLQLVESVVSMAVAGVGRALLGSTPGLPQGWMMAAGFSQLLAKHFLNSSLAVGLSYPVAIMAKSAKMVPVMLGSLLLGRQTYSARQILQAQAIVGGTSMVSFAEGKAKGGSSTGQGILLVLASLFCDGLVSGIQRRLKVCLQEEGKKARPFDSMFWHQFYMAVGAAFAAWRARDLQRASAYCRANPAILRAILTLGACSALGQCCIFYTIARFDPTVCAAITTTRKLASVLVSLYESGEARSLSPLALKGLCLGSVGILGQMCE